MTKGIENYSPIGLHFDEGKQRRAYVVPVPAGTQPPLPQVPATCGERVFVIHRVTVMGKDGNADPTYAGDTDVYIFVEDP